MAQGALGGVVGRLDLAVGHEDPEMLTDFPDDGLPLRPGRRGRGQGDQAVEPSFEVGLADFEGAVGEAVAPAPDRAGALKQGLHAGGEDRIAGVAGVLGVRCARQT